MKIVDLQRKLIAVARNNPPSDHVPFAFEKRIMARLAATQALDNAAFWVHALWRGAVTCVAVLLLLSAWSFCFPTSNTAGINLSEGFEDVVFAAVDQDYDNTW